MHYPGHDNWQGMSYGLLDETPVLSRTPSNPTIGDYLTEFQDRNRAWRESFKFPEFTPNSGRLDLGETTDPAADPILGQPRRPVLTTMPQDTDHESAPSDTPGAPVGDVDGALDLGSKWGALGMMIPFVPGLGLLGSLMGNAQSAANAGAMAGNSFGIGKDALDFSIWSGLLNDITFGHAGSSIADQLGALGHEIGYSPDGDFFDFDDSRNPNTGFTDADMAQMESDANAAAIGAMNTMAGAFDEAVRDELDDDLGPGGYDGGYGSGGSGYGGGNFT